MKNVLFRTGEGSFDGRCGLKTRWGRGALRVRLAQQWLNTAMPNADYGFACNDATAVPLCRKTEQPFPLR